MGIAEVFAVGIFVPQGMRDIGDMINCVPNVFMTR